MALYLVGTVVWNLFATGEAGGRHGACKGSRGRGCDLPGNRTCLLACLLANSLPAALTSVPAVPFRASAGEKVFD